MPLSDYTLWGDLEPWPSNPNPQDILHSLHGASSAILMRPSTLTHDPCSIEIRTTWASRHPPCLKRHSRYVFDLRFSLQSSLDANCIGPICVNPTDLFNVQPRMESLGEVNAFVIPSQEVEAPDRERCSQAPISTTSISTITNRKT